MLRQHEQIGANAAEKPAQDSAEAAVDALERRRKVTVRRTAWILGAIAVALFIASLVHGHYLFISHWPS